MTANRIHRPADRTPEELAELRATRERLQRERPAPEQLLAESGHPDFVPLGDLLLLHELASEFRRQRERQGLTLADVSSRTGIDQSTLSRLETGRAGNPSLDTLQRVAAALGKRVRCHLEDAAPLAGAGV